MLTSIFYKVIHNVWPMVFIFSFIIITFRLMYLIYNKQRLILYKELLMFFFIIYLLLLYYVVTFQDNNYGTSNFIPFKEIFRYDIFSPLFFKNIIGNILLFIPLGIFTSYYLKAKLFVPILILSFLSSSAIEFTQNCIGRTVDIDDVILNVAGALLGYLFYYILNKFINKVPKAIKSELALNILSLSIIFIIIYMFIKFEIWSALV